MLVWNRIHKEWNSIHASMDYYVFYKKLSSLYDDVIHKKQKGCFCNDTKTQSIDFIRDNDKEYGEDRLLLSGNISLLWLGGNDVSAFRQI